MQDIIIAVISSILGSSFIGLLVSAYIRRIFSRIDKLEHTVTRLKDDQIAGIDQRLELHIRNDKTTQHIQKFEYIDDMKAELKEHIRNDHSQEILSEMKHVRGGLMRVENKVDNIASETAEQRAKIIANKEYIANLDASFQMHKQHHK
ncbi:MAG: hypothetical protein L3J71_03595 [Victivallaceae bacterium]|nr:hypothetical protein [Victivallaceae bacterium]